MATSVVMPKLGLTMTEGVVEEWSKQEGDTVKKGEAICTISSEKLSQDVEASADGVLLKILVPAGETALCTAPIAYIGEADEKVGTEVAAASKPSSSEVATTASASAGPVAALEAPASTGKAKSGRIFISKLAKKIALEHGIDYRLVTGTGGNGRITRRDIERFIASEVHAEPVTVPSTASAAGAGLTGIRRAIAKNMMHSLHSTAQLTLQRKVDISALMQFRTELKSKLSDPSVLSLNILLLKAVALALRDIPEMNCHYDGQTLTQLEQINIGVAVSLDQGLVVPAIVDVAKKTLSEIAQDFRTTVDSAREGQFESNVAASFTITNLGSEGIEYFTPVINTPEIGILGVGALSDRLYFDEAGTIKAAKDLPLSLTFDHQIIDGAPAARFLSTIAEYLESPYQLLV